MFVGWRLNQRKYCLRHNLAQGVYGSDDTVATMTTSEPAGGRQVYYIKFCPVDPIQVAEAGPGTAQVGLHQGVPFFWPHRGRALWLTACVAATFC